jgi:amidophosphoribosyltransferase
MYGQSLHIARQRMGRELAREHPADGADIVIAVPDSGTPAALGFAEASGIPFGEGLIKNRYIQRTFIQPDQRMRELGVRMKLIPIRENLQGKRVVMVDDTIVRGTTTGKVVRLLLEAGAREVHVRISAPPVMYPCFYGIDMANQDQLVAANNSVAEIRQLIGATSLGYLSPHGLSRALSVPNDNFCLACFTGDYPIEIPPHVRISKFARSLPMSSGTVPAHAGAPLDAAGGASVPLELVAASPREMNGSGPVTYSATNGNGHHGNGNGSGRSFPPRVDTDDFIEGATAPSLPDDDRLDGIDDARPGG